MTKRSIFAKIFLITFALFSSLVILLHASVYFIFPSTYIESQRQTILKKSQALAKSFQDDLVHLIDDIEGDRQIAIPILVAADLIPHIF